MVYYGYKDGWTLNNFGAALVMYSVTHVYSPGAVYIKLGE